MRHKYLWCLPFGELWARSIKFLIPPEKKHAQTHTHEVDPGGWWKIAGSHKPIYHVSCLFILHEKERRKTHQNVSPFTKLFATHMTPITSRTLLPIVVVELSWLNDWNIRRIIKGDLWCISAEFYFVRRGELGSLSSLSKRRRRRWGLRRWRLVKGFSH